MKSASAMKYGGELVDAVDCDYDSFKELIPLCPNCKEPVFLRMGGQRESVKGKAYQIGPHWCHFKGISAEQVAGCELRVNGYTEKDRAKIAAQARGQRLKLLQRWFWRVWLRTHYETNPSSKDFSFDFYFDFITEEAGGWVQSLRADKDRNNIVDAVRCSIEKSWKSYSDISKLRSDALALMSRTLGEDHSAIDFEHVTACFNAVDDLSNKMNNMIASQAIDFVCSKKQSALLEELIAYSVYAVSSNEVHFRKYQASDKKSKADGIAFIILKGICVTNWASEFQRLETEAKQRKGAA